MARSVLGAFSAPSIATADSNSTESADHLVFWNSEHSRRCERGRCLPSNKVASHASFTKKVAWSEDRYDCLFSERVDNGQLQAAVLNVHDIHSGIALGVGFL